MCLAFNKTVTILADRLVGMPLTHRDGMFASKEDRQRAGRRMGKEKNVPKKNESRNH